MFKAKKANRSEWMQGVIDAEYELVEEHDLIAFIKYYHTELYPMDDEWSRGYFDYLEYYKNKLLNKS